MKEFFQNAFRLTRWLRTLASRPRKKPKTLHRGLVMIQIDGLSRQQMEQALSDGKLPFIARLLKNEHYAVTSHYSGLPSSTPAVQGELFYGVHTAVPSFGFRDPVSKKVTSMFDLSTAAAIESEIARGREPLFRDGSAYANVLTGGAPRNRYCLSNAGGAGWLKNVRMRVVARVVWLYIKLFLRLPLLGVIELSLAFTDFFRGMYERRNFWKELKFIPERVGICIMLRELVKARMLVDISLGLPIIQGNFLGYDEQAHRRGPSSAFAHWTLQGIDYAVSFIWQAAHRSRIREYDVWIYSDHGQEDVLQYARETGQPLHKAVQHWAEKSGIIVQHSRSALSGIQSRRFQAMNEHRRFKENGRITLPMTLDVTGLGPLAHVYFSEDISGDRKQELALNLVQHAKVPLVMIPDGPRQAIAWTREGRFSLPGDIEKIVGSEHPFVSDLAYDLVRLVHHPYAGALVLSGWHHTDKPLTFAPENGAHAGPGIHETHGFVVSPADTHLASKDAYVRPRDLRRAALTELGRLPLVLKSLPRNDPERRKHTRILTYNTHSCIGMDGTVSPGRIARVISRYDPDIVALQEVDMEQTRTGGVDQAKQIAGQLDMKLMYHPSYVLKEGSFGNAILSRLPMRIVRSELLPGNGKAEPRSALWAEIDTENNAIQVITTHLSFYPTERHIQIKALTGKRWLSDPACKGAVVLCGDFNMTQSSRSYRLITTALRDTLRGQRDQKRTWLGLACLDYVFVSPDSTTFPQPVIRNQLVQRASDHAPVVVDIETTDFH